MTGKNVVEIRGENWRQEVLQSKVPVLVDFWAPWCAPCVALGPVLEDLAGELAGRAKIAKVNVDENHQLAGDFGVRSIPTMLIFSGGVVREQVMGVAQRAVLRRKLDAYIAAP
jgi:thioredoxin 1